MNINGINFDALQNIKNKELFADLTVVVPSAENAEFKLHKIILSAASVFFEEHLTKTPATDRLVLPPPVLPESNRKTSQAPVYRAIFDAVYANKSVRDLINSGLSADNCFMYYSVADSLRFEPLKQAISEYIVSNIMHPSNLSQMVTEATKLQIPELLDRSMHALLEDFGKAINSKDQSDKLLRLPLKEFLALISNDNMVVDSEDAIFDLAIKYIELRNGAKPGPTPAPKPDDSIKPEPLAGGDPAAPPKEPPAPEPPGEPLPPATDPPVDPSLGAIFGVEDAAGLAERMMALAPLTDEQKKDILLCLRYKFISHEKIMREAKHPALAPFRDVLMEGLSAKLKNFEPNSLLYSINTNPRLHYTSMLVSNLLNHELPEEDLRKPATLAANSANRLGGMAKQIQKTGLGYSQQHANLQASQKGKSELIPGLPPGVEPKLPPGFGKSSFQPTDPQAYADFERKFRNEQNRSEAASSHHYKQAQHSPGQFAERPASSQLNPKVGFGANNYEVDSAYGGDADGELQFTYQFDFDENGALYFLGTHGKSAEYQNPYSLSMVKVFFSSMGKGSYEDFVGRSLVNCRTLNEPNAFMGIDLGQERYLVPSCYTIRNRDSGRHIMLNWLFEGSIDFKTWFILDKRIHKSDDPSYNKLMERERQMIERRGATSTWSVDQNYLKAASRSIVMQAKSFKGFRFFRIKQISKNSSGADNLALSGFEIYGIAKGHNWRF